MTDLVSIITPIYNAEKYLAEAIQSVLDQSHPHWELLLINDGSTDNSKEVALGFTDSRIRYFEQENNGVSAARNVGLQNMKGNFFCFLDADDSYTKRSISARLQIFKESSDIYFVDGRVTKWNEDMSTQVGEWTPNFKGNPFQDLLGITGKSFFGPSWMIRKKESVNYAFREGLTHGEDLLFFADLSRDPHAMYAYTQETILNYRIHQASAMRSDLESIEEGYKHISNEVKTWPEVSSKMLRVFNYQTRKIMFKSYLKSAQYKKAIKVWV